MKPFLDRLVRANPRGELRAKLTDEELTRRQVAALFNLLSDIYGSDKLILRAGKLEALDGMRSKDLAQQVLALQKVVFEDPTIEGPASPSDFPSVIDGIENEIADIIARKSVEDKVERKIAERMQQRHEDYVREIKLQIIKEDTGPENAQTLKKFAVLEKLEHKQLTKSALDILKPAALAEVVGQERAIKALLAKISSPYPQHVILYGPPGVGKTTVARLCLEEVKRLKHSPFANDAPFVEVDGTTLRWDPREVTNPLLGSVHDPIYQGARRDLADGGVPEPKLGLVTEAHGGILFIDEIGELEPMFLAKLLKVLEDKRVRFDSSYYDPDDPNVPKYVKKLFDEGAPADFVLIGATTREPAEINPAIRSRCAEVFFDPLGPGEIRQIVANAGRKLRVGVDKKVQEIISEYTIEGRKAIGILADAYGLALYQRAQKEREDEVAVTAPVSAGGVASDPVQADEAKVPHPSGPSAAAEATAGRRKPEPRLRLTREHIFQVIQVGRMLPNAPQKASDRAEVGKTFGLGVYGFMGSVIEVEALAFPVREPGKGTFRFNETAGSMAKDSVFNAASVIRRLTGKEISAYDLHVNVIGGGNIDGPSAGLAVFLAIYSTLERIPIRQDVAVTGEISIQGRTRAVGGIFEKIYGAKQAGMKRIILPRENLKDVPADVRGIEVVAVDTVEEALSYASAPVPLDTTTN
ncbi:MAG TPA: Lon family ATP-dependent protease [Bacillota bacterium]